MIKMVIERCVNFHILELIWSKIVLHVFTSLLLSLPQYQSGNRHWTNWRSFCARNGIFSDWENLLWPREWCAAHYKHLGKFSPNFSSARWSSLMQALDREDLLLIPTGIFSFLGIQAADGKRYSNWHEGVFVKWDTKPSWIYSIERYALQRSGDF